MTVAVSLTDTTVFTVDKHFRLLVDGDLARRPFGLSLGVVPRRIALVALPTYCPSVLAGNYMLVLAHGMTFQNYILQIKGLFDSLASPSDPTHSNVVVRYIESFPNISSSRRSVNRPVFVRYSGNIFPPE